MRKIFIIFFCFLGICACQQSANPDDEAPGISAPLDPYEQNELLYRSINLGNALEAPAEGDWGVTLKELYFQEIHAVGFSAVRIPIRWSAHTSIDSPYTIDPRFFSRVDWALDQALKYNLAAIINIHHFEEIFIDPDGQHEKFLALWKQIAEHYRQRPAQVFFEILNEPHDQLTASIWNQYLAEAIDIIRESDPYRTIIVGTAEWGGIGALSKLVIPANEDNVIVTIHYYNPFQFTHQGAEWVDGSDAWLGTKWYGTDADKNAVVQDFNQILSWQSQNEYPVFLGEFGSYSKADMVSRARYTDFIARYCESRQISWGYWEFCSGFGAYDPDQERWIPELLTALLPDSP